MKKVFTISICLISVFASSAQSYSSIFGLNSSSWDIPFCQLDQGIIQNYITVSDTIIGVDSYKKIGSIMPDNSISYDLYSGNGLAREDSITGKAWFLSIVETISGYDTTELLVMDLSLNIGDSFLVYGALSNTGVNPGPTTVIVDSVYDISTEHYVRLDYIPYGSNEKLTFIEGVGTNYGLNYMHNRLNLCPCLQEFQKDAIPFYENNQCQPIAGIKNETKKNNVLIFPNPVSNEAVLQFNNNNLLLSKLILYNSVGQIVNSFQTKSEEFKISNHEGLDGIFYFQLLVENQFQSAGKIVFKQ